MKNIRLITIIFALLVAVTCPAQKIFSELSSVKGVTSLYIGKGMLKLAGATIASSGSDAIDMTKLADSLNSIEIIQCEEKKAIPEVESLAQKALKNYPLELITEVSEDSEHVEISAVFKEDGEHISMILIRITEPKEIAYIILNGNIAAADLQSALQPK